MNYANLNTSRTDRGTTWPSSDRREPFGKLPRAVSTAADQSFRSDPRSSGRSGGFSRSGTESIAIIGDGNVADELAARARTAGWKTDLVPIFSPDGTGLADTRPSALADATIVVVALPPSAQPALSILLKDCLRPGALVVLVPGQPGGAGQLAQAFPGGDITVAETSWSPWQVGQNGKVIEVGPVPIATIPAGAASRVSRRLAPLVATVPAPDTRWTALHAPDVILRAVPGLIAGVDDGRTLGQALSDPAIARAVESVCQERAAIARSLGLDVPATPAWLAEVLGTSASSLVSALGDLTTGPVAKLFEANGPGDLVPFGVVPTLALGEESGVDTPVLRDLVTRANALLGSDFVLGGRPPTAVMNGRRR